MKIIMTFGVTLLLVSGAFFYFANTTDLFNQNMFFGLMNGLGVGLFVGGLVGYFSKSNQIKAKNKEAKIQKKEPLETAPFNEEETPLMG